MKKTISFFLVIAVLLGISFGGYVLFHLRKEQNADEHRKRAEEIIAGYDRAAAEKAMSKEPETTSGVSRAEQILRTMTPWEKVGQLFIVRPDSLQLGLMEKVRLNLVESGLLHAGTAETEVLRYYPVGGFCIFSQNIRSAGQLEQLIGELKDACLIAPILSVDEEGGPVARIANSGCFDVVQYRNMSYLAQIGDTQNAKDAGFLIGSYLKELGFQLDFAPVADVNTNPDNIVIGVRAFGDDPYVAAGMVAAEVEGFRIAGIGCTLKHFPGHGDTSSDTHTGAAYSYKTWNEIQNCEMIPFIAGIRAGADAVMVSHISLPKVTGTSVPSSLSYEIVTGKLREELGFEGLIITDSMEMSAITSYMDANQAAVQAILAGVDVILLPEDLEGAYEAVYTAVRNGTITAERLDESVTRILEYKLRYGILN